MWELSPALGAALAPLPPPFLAKRTHAPTARTRPKLVILLL